MECESCNGTGNSANEGQPCFFCNGSGHMCDGCGEAMTNDDVDLGAEMCQACLDEQGDQ